MFYPSSVLMEEVTYLSMAEQPKKHMIQVVKDYGKKLFSFIRARVGTREEAEDILQDVWFQLSNMIDLDSIGHLSGWLYQVARNRITDNYRKKGTVSIESLALNNEEEDTGLMEIILSDPSTPEMEALRELFWEELFKALDELPENQKQVFIMNELENKTLRRISEETGENLKTIISRKGYAVKHLRNRLGNLYTEFINY